MITYLVIAGIILCIYLSGFFSGSEMSYSSCNTMRLENEKEEGSKKAGVALGRLKESRRSSLYSRAL